MPDLRYFGPDAIARCGLTPHEVAVAVRDACVARAAGRAVTAPGLHLRLDASRKFSAKAAVLPDEGLAAVKWYGVMAGNAAVGLAEYAPLVVLSETAQGQPVAVFDGAWLTAARTAAITAVAARVLAPRDTVAVGFIGCGKQAEAHFEALRRHYALERITACSRNGAGAARLAAAARAEGMAAEVVTDPRAAIDDHDIVVTAIPRQPAQGRLRTEWLRSDAFVAMVDTGFAWAPETVGDFALRVADALDPVTRQPLEPVAFAVSFDVDLADLVADPARAAGESGGRRALIFAGSALADTAVAVALYRRATALGLGVPLPH